MRDPDLEADFPGLGNVGYVVRSPRDPKYNCIAYALGDLQHYWYDVGLGGYYWPPRVPSADTLEGWITIFADHGYVETSDDELEPDFEKVAIYALDGVPEHVARQRASGVWTSKMGRGHDIDHA